MNKLINGILFNQVRTYFHRSRPRLWNRNAVKFEKVTFYPRRKKMEEEVVNPAKLLMIRRVKKFKGNPYWDKAILLQLKLDDKQSDIAIVKNTPDMCALLWRIKHLIEVTPINLPENLPESDAVTPYLHENGDLMMFPPLDPKQEQITKDFMKDPKRLDRETLKTELRLRWINSFNLY